MSASVDELRARLAALRGERAGIGDDRAEIAEMFAECDRQSLELGWKNEDEERFMLRDMKPDDPVPNERERGRRFCPRCGIHKRLASFDLGADACKSHDDEPPRRRERAA